MSVPPEQHPEQRYYDHWKRLAPLGLAAVGLGASLLGQATLWKGEGKTARWIVGGTAGLVCLNGGLCVFGEAVKNRLRYDLAREQQGSVGEAPAGREAGS